MFDDFDVMVQSDELSDFFSYEDYLDSIDNDDNNFYPNSYDKSYYDYQENRLSPYRGLDI